jgi:YegS/Rv2252/BmrU family lipid kinase
MSQPPRHVQVIINPAAGRTDRPILNTMNRVFRRHGVDWRVAVTHTDGDGRKLAKKALRKQKYDLVLAYGGDGTVRDVANGLAGAETPMAILAGGTGNAVATEFKIPHNLERALEQICQMQGQIRPVDMGLIGKRYFLLRADTGLSAKVMQQTSREMKDRLGVLAYLLTFARTVAEAPQKTAYQLTVDGQAYETRGAACVITNISSIGTLGLNLGENVRYDDGRLDVFVLSNDFFSIVSAAASVVELTQLERIFQHWQGQQLEVRTARPQAVNCDAEPYTHTPIIATVIPGALRLFVPT